MGEELADSLLTGEMSLLLLVWLTGGEPAAEGGFRGICHEGILGIVGVDGNCLLWMGGVRGWQTRALHQLQFMSSNNFKNECEKSVPTMQSAIIGQTATTKL